MINTSKTPNARVLAMTLKGKQLERLQRQTEFLFRITEGLEIA